MAPSEAEKRRRRADGDSWARRGRASFVSHRCSACHGTRVIEMYCSPPRATDGMTRKARTDQIVLEGARSVVKMAMFQLFFIPPYNLSRLLGTLCDDHKPADHNTITPSHWSVAYDDRTVVVDRPTLVTIQFRHRAQERMSQHSRRTVPYTEPSAAGRLSVRPRDGIGKRRR